MKNQKSDKPAKKPNPHVGPGKRSVCVYFDEELHEKVKARARELGLPVNRYLQSIAKIDMRNGGDITILAVEPEKSHESPKPKNSDRR